MSLNFYIFSVIIPRPTQRPGERREGLGVAVREGAREPPDQSQRALRLRQRDALLRLRPEHGGGHHSGEEEALPAQHGK